MIGSKAIASFFEDIPSLLLVTVAIAVFLIAAVSAYGNYLENREEESMDGKLESITRSLRSEPVLISSDTAGLLSGPKIADLNVSDLIGQYDPEIIGYEYQIAIMDKSQYSNADNYTVLVSTKELPSEGNTYSMTTPINIWVSSTEVHNGLMVVTIWR